MSIRMFALYLARSIGLFRFAKFLTREHLRIICYHGAEISDESLFKPKLFISEQIFRSRMEVIRRYGYRVVSLSEGISALGAGTLAPSSIVITIDDGWYGSYRTMAPILAEFGYPATLYLSTYYVEHRYPVFNVALDYVFWRTSVRSIDLAQVDASLGGAHNLLNSLERASAVAKIRAHGEAINGAARRQEILVRVCELLEVDIKALVDSRMLSFMSASEVAELANYGIDVQLHTHRHRFPSESIDESIKEIEDNRGFLKFLGSDTLVHFCYPSGTYKKEQIPWLKTLGIESATTTALGTNTQRQSVFELRRILDANDLSNLGFHAELSGFLSIARRAFGR